MKKHTKTVALLVAALLVLGLSACGGEKDGDTTTVPSDAGTSVPSATDSSTEPSTTANEASNKKGTLENGVYTNGWANIAFRMPEGWIDTTAALQAFSSAAAEFVFGCQDPEPADGFYANLNINISDISSSPQLKTSEEYAVAAKQSLSLVNQAQGIDCAVDDDLVKLNLCGEDYVAVRCECAKDGVSYIQYSLCRVTGSDAVVITVSVPSEEAAADLLTFFIGE